MARQLKVFRTPTGFHDAYVAAPSRKAALAAWGTDVDLFARGAAEQITDPELMKAPLAEPGRVIRTIRGTMEEHLAALPATPKRKRSPATAGDKPARSRQEPSKPKATPRPSRADLDEAEEAIAVADRRFDEMRRELAAREAALAKERRALEVAHRTQKSELEEQRVEQEKAYKAAVSAWIDQQD